MSRHWLAMALLLGLLPLPGISLASTRFLDSDGNTIDEIRIRGNREIGGFHGLLFMDVGNAWQMLGQPAWDRLAFSMGIGLAFGQALRLNLAHALESGRSPQLNFRWSRGL